MNACAAALLGVFGMLGLALNASFGESAIPSSAANETLMQGATFRWNGRMATVDKLESLPHVESEYTRRFTFDSFANPKLKELRDQYQLEQVIAGGKDEFERQVLLMDWTHHRFKKFGKPTNDAR